MNCSRKRCSPMLQKSLDLRLRGAQAKAYLKWGSFNVVLLLLLIYDLSQTWPSLRRGYYIFLAECAGATVVALNAVACLAKCLWLWFSGVLVFGTYAQKCLLDGYDGNSFRTICIQKVKKPRCREVDTYCKDYLINWHSSFEDSRCHRRRSIARTPQRQNACAEVPHDDCLTDVRQLPALMKSARSRRRSLEISDGCNAQHRSSGSTFWIRGNSQVIKLKTIYQLAPPPPVCTENAPTTIEEFSSFQFKDSSSEAISRIATDKLAQYVANLRYWISTTILQRLVNEIDNVDKMFRHRGLNDLKIGAASLERLRVAAENQQFVQTCAPTLPTLLLFLDAFSNQEYLVQRIKDLSQGCCLADFGCNSGNTAHNGREWGDQLPTDAAIVFHLFCSYLDSQLMLTHQGGWRPFYHHYVLVCDEKRSIAVKDIAHAVHNLAHCAILCSGSPLDPKFNLISGKELHNCAYDRNNLFCVIIQFLIYMRQQQQSSLEGVSLGKSGINIMCVIDN